MSLCHPARGGARQADALTALFFSASLVLFGACHSRPAPVDTEDCAPATTELPASSSAQELAGNYRLRLVATSGPRKGAAVDGSLLLKSQNSLLRYRTRPGGARDSSVLHPLFGAADIDLTTVDAVAVGSTTSVDPAQPGVLVMERHTARSGAPRAEIIMRLGSEANRRDRVRFDGGYTALRVNEASKRRIAGSWASGVSGEQSSGYFCAVRR